MVGRGVVYGGGDALNQQQKLKISSHDQPHDSIFASASSNSFISSSAMVSFGAVRVNKSGNMFYCSFDQEESGDEYLDESLNHSEKKRRLTVDQVQFLEKSFDAENKLEPEKKSQLASELGLQPRQIAIWFQNRRARLKTKQVETDYETLHARYNSLKTDYDKLLEENEKLKEEVFHLKDNVLARDEEKGNSQLCDTKALPESLMKNPIFNSVSRDEESTVLAGAFMNEDQSSARSDVIDIDSPRFTTNKIRSSLLESGSHVFDPDQSDFNDDLVQASYDFPKMEDGYCHPLSNSCYFGFPVEDNGFSFWSY